MTIVAPDLTRRISDRPGNGVSRRFGQHEPANVTSMHGYLSRRISGGGYDPLAHLRHR
jgi:hypothetical protein